MELKRNQCEQKVRLNNFGLKSARLAKQAETRAETTSFRLWRDRSSTTKHPKGLMYTPIILFHILNIRIDSSIHIPVIYTIDKGCRNSNQMR